jgi:hypothetical protein
MLCRVANIPITRCLAHVIHLATRALISTYSKAPYYDPGQPHILGPAQSSHRDEVDLIRAIVVKERSSAQRKQLFKDIQSRPPNPSPVVSQLLLDMPVRWSSTYVMLDRAEKKRQYVDTFIYELGLRESNLSKRAKIDDLKLSSDEWNRVKLFTSLLAVRY